MSDIFFVSDTHWGHANVIRYSNRPFTDVDHMNEILVKNWNEVVKPEDTVWHLGDFAFMSYPEFKKLIWRLNGNINVCLGNHDKVIIGHQKELLSMGKIKSIQHYVELKIEGTMIVLAHYGHRVWNKSHYGSIMLYGHSHGSLPPFGKSVDVGVDCKEITSEYRPVSLEEVNNYMSKRSFQSVDHHGKKKLDED